MRLLSIASLLGFALSVYGCGYANGDQSTSFMEHVSSIFSYDIAFWTISFTFETWYNAQTTTIQSDEVACSEQFIAVLIAYEKGELTEVTADPGELVNYLYGLYPIVYGLQYYEATYITMVTSYSEACPFDTFTAVTTVAPATASPVVEKSQQTKADFLSIIFEFQGFSTSSFVYQQCAACYTTYASDGMSSDAIASVDEQCTQLALYYVMYPGYLDPTTEPAVPECSIDQYYSVLGYIFSSYELRIQFATSFYNYFAGCPNAPLQLQWGKVIKDSCLIQSGTVTIETESGCTGTEMIEPCVEMVYQLISEGNTQVIEFINIYMVKILGIAPEPSTVTFTGNVEQYSYMMECIAESAGFTTWSVYIEFQASFTTFCAGRIDIDWTEIQIWITNFFHLCCEYTTPATTEAVVTELATTELASTVEVSIPTASGSPATCYEMTPEEECLHILSYFRFIGFLYINAGWRSSLNEKCATHKRENPDCSNSDKAKFFTKATHDCAREVACSGSGSSEDSEECREPTATPAPVAPETEAPLPTFDGPAPPAGEESWEYFVDFAIEIFLVGNWELLTEGACTMAKYQPAFPTSFSSGSGSGSGSGEAPTVSPSCDEIKSPSGIFIFFEIIAIECGFEGTWWYSEWILKFKAIFLSLDWDCGCWGEFIWTWSIDWIELIFEFLQAMICGCAPTEPPGPTPPPSASFEIFGFFAYFCSNTEYRYKFECFMSWYFELKGYTQFEELSETEAYQCISLFIDYMVICMTNPTTPTKPLPSSGLYITYDTFIYSCMYYVNFEGNTRITEMVASKNEKCQEARDEDDSGSGSGSGSDSGSTSMSTEAPEECGADMVTWVIKYMAVYQGCYTELWFQTFWIQFNMGMTVVEEQSTSSQQWTQAQMLCDVAIQMICNYVGPSPILPSTTVAP